MRQSIACGMILWLTLSGCSGEDTTKAPATRPAVPVRMASVQVADLDRNIELVGTLYGDEEVQISAKVAGRITQVKADIGDRVAPGELLAQIDPIDYQLEVDRRKNALAEALVKLGLTEMPGPDFDVAKVSTVERARFQSANAQAKLERARKLFEQTPPLLSEQDFADIQTAAEVAKRDYDVALLESRSQVAAVQSRKSELGAAQEQLASTRIVAPPLDSNRKFAVATRSISAGEYVREGSALYRLVLDDKIKFRGALPERFSGQLQVGQPVQIRVEGSDKPAAGVVARVNPAIDTATRTFQIEALLDNASLQLHPGAFARATITVGKQKGATLVPKQAIVTFAGVNRVFGVRDGKAVENIVTPGDERDGMVQVNLKGVTEVVVSGQQKLANGLAVTLDQTPAPTTQR